MFKQFKKIVVCELNDGQFAKILKMNFNDLNIVQFNKIQGLPFSNGELVEKFKQLLK